jgi:hypothetical protein
MANLFNNNCNYLCSFQSFKKKYFYKYGDRGRILIKWLLTCTSLFYIQNYTHLNKLIWVHIQGVPSKSDQLFATSIYFNVQKYLFYYKIIFSDWVTGTPVNFGGMTGKAQVVILKLNFWKSCDRKKSYIYTNIVGFWRDTLYISGNTMFVCFHAARRARVADSIL